MSTIRITWKEGVTTEAWNQKADCFQTDAPMSVINEITESLKKDSMPSASKVKTLEMLLSLKGYKLEKLPATEVNF